MGLHVTKSGMYELVKMYGLEPPALGKTTFSREYRGSGAWLRWRDAEGRSRKVFLTDADRRPKLLVTRSQWAGPDVTVTCLPRLKDLWAAGLMSEGEQERLPGFDGGAGGAT